MKLEQRIERLEHSGRRAHREHVVVQYKGETREKANKFYDCARIENGETILYVLIRGKLRSGCLIDTDPDVGVSPANHEGAEA